MEKVWDDSVPVSIEAYREMVAQRDRFRGELRELKDGRNAALAVLRQAKADIDRYVAEWRAQGREVPWWVEEVRFDLGCDTPGCDEPGCQA